MKILLLGAAGMVGARISAEADNRGHEVTRVSRSGRDGTGAADALDAGAVSGLVAGHDAVVVSVSFRDGADPAERLLTVARNVLDAQRKTGVRRMIWVGGAGSLEIAPGTRLLDTPDFPDEYKPEALAAAKVLDHLRSEADDLDWTYISPAIVIQPGERTGVFRLGGDEVLVDAEGNGLISAEDYAVALVDELDKPQAIRRRITVAY